MKALPLLSGGKDSLYAMYIALQQGFKINRVLTVHPQDIYSTFFHYPNTRLTKLQAEAMGLEIVELSTSNDDEIKSLRLFLENTHEDYIIVGTISSEYQFYKMIMLCEETGKKLYAPLWKKPALNLLFEMVNAGIEFIIVAVSAEGLDKSMLGIRVREKEISLLKELNERYGINPVGEGGEFETFVINAPIFKKRIVIKRGQVIWKISHGYFLIEEATLI